LDEIDLKADGENTKFATEIVPSPVTRKGKEAGMRRKELATEGEKRLEKNVQKGGLQWDKPNVLQTKIGKRLRRDCTLSTASITTKKEISERKFPVGTIRLKLCRRGP